MAKEYLQLFTKDSEFIKDPSSFFRTMVRLKNKYAFVRQVKEYIRVIIYPFEPETIYS
jgi:hypothetical protein